MLRAEEIKPVFEVKENCLAPGLEHIVAVSREDGLVIKVYDTRLFDEAGYPCNKPTEGLFDYLTDHLLANHFFGDDVRLLGFYEDEGSLHIVITQPFIRGVHPSWQELVERLESQGLEHESPNSTRARFWVDGGPAGRILVTDVHEDNVIVSPSGIAYPIDVHFGFANRRTRIAALEILGLWEAGA